MLQLNDMSLEEARLLIRMWWNSEQPKSVTGNKDESPTSNSKAHNKHLLVIRKGYWEFPGQTNTSGKERWFKKEIKNVYARAWHKAETQWLFVNEWMKICEVWWLSREINIKGKRRAGERGEGKSTE